MRKPNSASRRSAAIIAAATLLTLTVAACGTPYPHEMGPNPPAPRLAQSLNMAREENPVHWRLHVMNTRLTTNGHVTNIDEDGGIWLGSRLPKTEQLKCVTSDLERVADLRPGDRITVSGTMSEVEREVADTGAERHIFILSECELIEVN